MLLSRSIKDYLTWQTVYAATKAAVSQMARSFSTVLPPRNIRLNAVSPEVIDTDMTEAMDDEVINRLKYQIPMQRLGQPEEIVKAVLLPASDDASYIVGEDLLVDGGRIKLSL